MATITKEHIKGAGLSALGLGGLVTLVAFIGSMDKISAWWISHEKGTTAYAMANETDMALREYFAVMAERERAAEAREEQQKAYYQEQQDYYHQQMQQQQYYEPVQRAYPNQAHQAPEPAPIVDVDEYGDRWCCYERTEDMCWEYGTWLQC